MRVTEVVSDSEADADTVPVMVVLTVSEIEDVDDSVPVAEPDLDTESDTLRVRLILSVLESDGVSDSVIVSVGE